MNIWALTFFDGKYYNMTTGLDFHCQNVNWAWERNEWVTVTYRLEIPQCDYLPIVELEEHIVFRPELNKELWQRLLGRVGLRGHQNWMEAGGDFKSQWLEGDKWWHINTEKIQKDTVQLCRYKNEEKWDGNCSWTKPKQQIYTFEFN